MDTITKLLTDITAFNALLIAMTILAIMVFVALQRVEAAYGMLYSKRWGPAIGNRAGWVIMEAPVFFAMAALWWFSGRRAQAAPLVFFILFQMHYFQRSFIFPMLIRGKNRMPVAIIVMGVVFNLVNALMQGGWIFYLSPAGMYTSAWLCTPQFITGVIVFFAGMAVNLHSDHIIRNLRQPGDTRHYIPRGGMFRYVSSANYLGEWVEWVGFAVLTWSAAGAVFALWTFANLAPRAAKTHKRYSAEFGEEFSKLRLKRMIPFIY